MFYLDDDPARAKLTTWIELLETNKLLADRQKSYHGQVFNDSLYERGNDYLNAELELAHLELEKMDGIPIAADHLDEVRAYVAAMGVALEGASAAQETYEADLNDAIVRLLERLAKIEVYDQVPLFKMFGLTLEEFLEQASTYPAGTAHPLFWMKPVDMSDSMGDPANSKFDPSTFEAFEDMFAETPDTTDTDTTETTPAPDMTDADSTPDTTDVAEDRSKSAAPAAPTTLVDDGPSMISPTNGGPKRSLRSFLFGDEK